MATVVELEPVPGRDATKVVLRGEGGDEGVREEAIISGDGKRVMAVEEVEASILRQIPRVARPQNTSGEHLLRMEMERRQKQGQFPRVARLRNLSGGRLAIERQQKQQGHRDSGSNSSGRIVVRWPLGLRQGQRRKTTVVGEGPPPMILMERSEVLKLGLVEGPRDMQWRRLRQGQRPKTAVVPKGPLSMILAGRSKVLELGLVQGPQGSGQQETTPRSPIALQRRLGRWRSYYYRGHSI